MDRRVTNQRLANRGHWPIRDQQTVTPLSCLRQMVIDGYTHKHTHTHTHIHIYIYIYIYLTDKSRVTTVHDVNKDQKKVYS